MRVSGDRKRSDGSVPARGRGRPAPGLAAAVGNRAFAGLVADGRVLGRVRLPFANRYGAGGSNVMDTVTSGGGGLVQYPSGGQPRGGGGAAPQLSVVSGSSYADMSTGEERAISQNAVMGISPNDAAKALGLPCPAKLSWEWLHLVAHSFRQTHVDSLSTDSAAMIEKSGQPQQIRENLVLGTAAANTAMLTYETAIKDILRRNLGWTVDLFVAASKDDRTIPGRAGKQISVPVATRIDYHFMFRTGDGRVVPPVVLAFDPASHLKPPRSEFAEVVAALDEHIGRALGADVEGMRTSGMTATPARPAPPAAPAPVPIPYPNTTTGSDRTRRAPQRYQ